MSLKFDVYKPSLFLSEFVNCYWTIKGSVSDEEPIDEIVYPTGKAEIIFHFKNSFFSNELSGAKQSDFLFCGQKTRRDLVTASGEIDSLALTFKSSGAAAFFEIPMNEIENSNMNLNYLIPTKCALDLERMFDSKDDLARIAILEHFLLSRFIEKKYYDIKRFSGACLEIKKIKRYNLNKLADYSNLSERQFQRRFKEFIGIKPIELFRINRFERALKRIEKTPTSFTEVAYDEAYTDQSHLIRDFKAFLNMTPSEYYNRYVLQNSK
jgi:AraC-like DNA-binding protein